MDADLKSGNSSLSDGVGPLYSWVSDFRQLVIFYNSAQWNSLAFSVMQIGYANDIAYYFLGSSAEGLGYYDAALKYYNLSKEFYSDPHRTHHCRDSAEGCGGLRLDVLIPTKMDIVQQKIANTNTPKKYDSSSRNNKNEDWSNYAVFREDNTNYIVDKKNQIGKNLPSKHHELMSLGAKKYYSKTLDEKQLKTILKKLLPKENFEILYSNKVKDGRGFRYSVVTYGNYIFLDSMSLFGEAIYDASVLINKENNDVKVCWRNFGEESVLYIVGKKPKNFKYPCGSDIVYKYLK